MRKMTRVPVETAELIEKIKEKVEIKESTKVIHFALAFLLKTIQKNEEVRTKK